MVVATLRLPRRGAENELDRLYRRHADEVLRYAQLVLRSQPDIELVGEAADGAAAIEVLRATEADVVLMDARMPRMGGVEATGLFRTTTSWTRTTKGRNDDAIPGVHAGRRERSHAAYVA